MPQKPILVTGGAGFIGSNFVLRWLQERELGRSSISTSSPTPAIWAIWKAFRKDPRHIFVHGDICDRKATCGDAENTSAAGHRSLRRREPRRPFHPRARRFHPHQRQRHIHAAGGSPRLLDRDVGRREVKFPFPPCFHRRSLRLLAADDPPFTETTAYAPNSPYAASKAASDHLVRAYHHTYGLPVLTTNCSNNYGPYQFPEKLIPLMILRAITGKPIPVYGDGKNVRDWLYVEDHCDAIRTVLSHGRVGETYNIGGNNEKPNLEIVETICSALDELRPSDPVVPHSKLDHLRAGPPRPRPPLRHRSP